MPIPDEQAFTTGATEFGGTLEDRLRFETLLADLFARFVNVPADRLNRGIGNAHRTICEALRIDHSSVWQITPDNPEEFVLIHLVRDPNLPPPPERMRGIDYFPWVQAKLQAKEVVIVEDTAKAPPEASTDLQNWQYFRLKSSLVFPLYVGSGPVLGVLSFDDTCRPRDYPEPLRNRLQLLAQVFASALDRERADQKLRDSEMRLSLAAASAGAGLWTIKVGDSRVWATEKARELYGVSSDQKLTFDFFLGLDHPEDRERVRGAVQDAIRTGDETAAEYRIVLPDGAVRWIAARGRRQSGQAGESDRLKGVSSGRHSLHFGGP